jgi:streptogramin lyase
MRCLKRQLCCLFSIILATTLAGQDSWRTPNGVVHLIREVRDATALQLPIQVLPITNRLSNDITCIGEDGRGYLWLTHNSGISRFDGYDWKFLASSPSDSTTMMSEWSGHVKMDEHGDPWFAAEGGISHFVDSTESFENFRHMDFFKGPGIGNTEVRMVCPDLHSTIWCGTTALGLCRFDMKTHLFDCNLGESVTDLIEKNQITIPINVSDIDLDKQGKLWCAAFQEQFHHSRLYSFDPLAGDWQRFTFTGVHTDKKSTIGHVSADNLVWGLTPDKADSLVWVHGPGAGLRSFNKNTATWEQFFIDDNAGPNSDANEFAVDIEPYSDSLLFIGRGDGYFMFNKRSKTFYRLNSFDGVKSIGKGRIQPNAHGDLWFTSQFNLFKLENPSRANTDTVLRRPKLWLKSFLADGEQYLPHPIQKPSLIQLPDGCQKIEIAFYGLPFMVPNRLEYRYRLDENNSKWVDIGQKHELVFENLVGGHHQLLIQTRRPGEIWSESVALDFSIDVPFWKNRWLQAIAALLLGSGIFFFYKMKIREAREESDFKRQIAEAEMAGLRAQMNPHFLFNCLASINHLLQENDGERASAYLTKFSRLVRLILENSKSERISLENELDSLQLYLEMEALRFEPKLEFDVKIHPEIEPETILLPPMLIQPFVENAIWHGLMPKPDGGKITIECLPDGLDRLRIVVTDNGIGRAKSQELASRTALKKKSHGLQITDDRVRLLNSLYNTDTSIKVADLIDDMGRAAGTRVELRVSI